MLWYMGECHGIAGYFPAENCVFLDGVRCTEEAWRAIAGDRHEEEEEDDEEEEGKEKKSNEEKENTEEGWGGFTKEEKRRKENIREFLSYARINPVGGKEGEGEEELPRSRCSTSNDETERTNRRHAVDNNDVVKEGIVKARVSIFKEIEENEGGKPKERGSPARSTRKTVAGHVKRWEIAVEQPSIKSPRQQPEEQGKANDASSNSKSNKEEDQKKESEDKEKKEERGKKEGDYG